VAATALFVCRPNLWAAGPDLAAAEAAVRKADADWAAAASNASVDQWMAFYAADAVVLLPQEPLASGEELVRHSVADLLALPHVSVAWHPVKAEMARSGNLAYLMGAYELRFGDSHGAPAMDRGRVLRIWRKQPDGMWKCLVDTWNSDELTAKPSREAPSPVPEVRSSNSAAANSGTAPLTPAEATAAKYGDEPSHYKEAIQQYFQEHLKDPDSVQYREITNPEQGYTAAITGTVFMRETRNYGWTVRATINAKNPHGRYSGFKSYTFLFRGEKIVHTQLPLPGDEMN
jgi:ketosteroid isomerase-like protein